MTKMLVAHDWIYSTKADLLQILIADNIILTCQIQFLEDQVCQNFIDIIVIQKHGPWSRKLIILIWSKLRLILCILIIKIP